MLDLESAACIRAIDTHWMEHYMSTPQENADGYREGSPVTHAASLSGKLLIVHGMLDENVHFRHTALFVDALLKANKPHDLLILPNERHGPRDAKGRRGLEERLVDYFKTNL